MKDLHEQLKNKFGDQVSFEVPLYKHSTYKIGGLAEILIMPESDELLKEVFAFVKQHDLKYLILGGGSNIVLPDEGFAGIVIKPRNRDFLIQGEIVKAGAGVVLGKLATETAKAGLTGLEWGIAVPGTLGGAVRGNAGAFGGEIKDLLVQAEVFDGQEVRTMSNKELEFAYRSSLIKRNGELIVINATLKLELGDAVQAIAKVKELMNTKFNQQPMGEPCAGCVFKNIEVDPISRALKASSKGEPNNNFHKMVPDEFFQKGKVSAGWLIEKAGLMGFEKDGIKVSEKHANFFVNTGSGTSKAVKNMVDHVKAKVFAKFGVLLEEEVQIVS